MGTGQYGNKIAKGTGVIFIVALVFFLREGFEIKNQKYVRILFGKLLIMAIVCGRISILFL